VLVASTGAAAYAGAQPPPPLLSVSSEMALQGCFAGEGRCTTDPVTTSDGRILIQLVPAFVGEVHVFLDARHGSDYVYTCHAPTAQLTCSRIVETGVPGTYSVTVEFGPATQGAVFVEVVTPS
jgi:hypothetical protein